MDTYLYSESIVDLYVTVWHIHTGRQVDLSVQIIWLQHNKKSSNSWSHRNVLRKTDDSDQQMMAKPV